MITQAIVFSVILTVLLLWLYNRHRIRYWVELLYERGIASTIHYDRCLTIFNNVYAGTNPTAVSLRERREKNIEDPTFTYGEVTFFSFVRILERAEPKPGEVFYDLGSGAGKAVVIAALVFNFSKACGVEKLDDVYALSIQMKEKLQHIPEFKQYFPHKPTQIEFIHNDLVQQDFSDADIVFISGTCFGKEMFNTLITKLLRLKVGSRVILGTVNLEGIGGFKLKYANLHLMSWGLNTIKIYERI